MGSEMCIRDRTIGMMALKGFDGVQMEIQSTCKKLQKQTSNILVLYFYYMQVQRLIFQGKWETLRNMKNREVLEPSILNSGQRKEYLNKVRFLVKIWRWNGLDFPLFLIAVLGLFSMPGSSLHFLSYAISAQFIITYLLHFFLNRKILRKS